MYEKPIILVLGKHDASILIECIEIAQREIALNGLGDEVQSDIIEDAIELLNNIQSACIDYIMKEKKEI